MPAKEDASPSSTFRASVPARPRFSKTSASAARRNLLFPSSRREFACSFPPSPPPASLRRAHRAYRLFRPTRRPRRRAEARPPRRASRSPPPPGSRGSRRGLLRGCPPRRRRRAATRRPSRGASPRRRGHGRRVRFLPDARRALVLALRRPPLGGHGGHGGHGARRRLRRRHEPPVLVAEHRLGERDVRRVQQASLKDVIQRRFRSPRRVAGVAIRRRQRPERGHEDVPPFRIRDVDAVARVLDVVLRFEETSRGAETQRRQTRSRRDVFFLQRESVFGAERGRRDRRDARRDAVPEVSFRFVSANRVGSWEKRGGRAGSPPRFGGARAAAANAAAMRASRRSKHTSSSLSASAETPASKGDPVSCPVLGSSASSRARPRGTPAPRQRALRRTPGPRRCGSARGIRAH